MGDENLKIGSWLFVLFRLLDKKNKFNFWISWIFFYGKNKIPKTKLILYDGSKSFTATERFWFLRQITLFIYKDILVEK